MMGYIVPCNLIFNLIDNNTLPVITHITANYPYNNGFSLLIILANIILHNKSVDYNNKCVGTSIKNKP